MENLIAKTSPEVMTSLNLFNPAQFDSVQRVAKMLSSSMLVPDTYQTRKIYNDLVRKEHMEPKAALASASSTAISNCAIALDISMRIGASPLMVMQNLAIIYGRPSWSSKFLIATVNTCGRFEPLKFRFTEKGKLGKFNYVDYVYDEHFHGKKAVTKEFDGSKIMDLECVAYTTAKNSDKLLESSPITLRMAVEEGWYTKNGSKWRTMPKQMLMYRAASFWTNVYAPELSMGMRTIEEIQDMGEIQIPDAVEEVNEEKAQKANREAIGFGDEHENLGGEADTHEPVNEDKTEDVDKVPDNVDPDTGEILNADPRNGASAENQQQQSNTSGSKQPDMFGESAAPAAGPAY